MLVQDNVTIISVYVNLLNSGMFCLNCLKQISWDGRSKTRRLISIHFVAWTLSKFNSQWKHSECEVHAVKLNTEDKCLQYGNGHICSTHEQRATDWCLWRSENLCFEYYLQIWLLICLTSEKHKNCKCTGPPLSFEELLPFFAAIISNQNTIQTKVELTDISILHLKVIKICHTKGIFSK